MGMASAYSGPQNRQLREEGARLPLAASRPRLGTSGLPAFDNAVERYVEKAPPLYDSLESYKTNLLTGGAPMTDSKYVAFDVHQATISAAG